MAVVAVVWVRSRAEWPFQRRNLTTAEIGLIAAVLLGVWWIFFSRAKARLRLGVIFGLVGLITVTAGLFRIRGVSGDLVPILEFRWANRALPAATPALALTNAASMTNLMHN